MTTHTTKGGHHWSHILRLLAPGPLALGMHVYIHPTLWWAIDAKRDVAQPQGEDEGMARGER